MRILFINQFYVPDTAATGQLLADLAAGFVARGHEVHVLCSRRSYNGGSQAYPKKETVNGVLVHRVGATGMGRGGALGRLLDYASFYLLAGWRALTLPKMDVCICLTTPPFIGLVGSMLRRLKKTELILWTMDLYPEVLSSFGVLNRKALLYRILSRVSRHLYRRACLVISLGDVMTERLVDAGAASEKIVTVHNWVPAEIVPGPDEQAPVSSQLKDALTA